MIPNRSGAAVRLVHGEEKPVCIGGVCAGTARESLREWRFFDDRVRKIAENSVMDTLCAIRAKHPDRRRGLAFNGYGGQGLPFRIGTTMSSNLMYFRIWRN